ncbi:MULTISPECIES: hypothetical protein [Paenibacillus]|uniref:hypothetical protein n=1 Tax=Paenibacillus TaxID=44249 RepID=UPI000A926EDF|nr:MULTISPECIES: hypothetical protein [Paenibacillus]
MAKLPIGYVLAGAAMMLAFSPEARKTMRKFAVKGTEAVLNLTEQAKDTVEGLRK